MVERKGCALGSAISITALHSDPKVAEQAIDAAFAELGTVEQVMSLYRTDSEIRRLNATSHIDRPHPYLVQVLTKAEAVSRQSRGAFDVSVQPLWDLYYSSKRNGQTPTDAEVDAVRGKVDWRRIEVSPQGIRLLADGMAITLNGIAQGFAADRVMAALRARGVEHALVNTGEIGTIGPKAGNEPWVAGIQHPRKPDAYISLAKLDGRCMATSGDYATTFDDEHLRHHIFDPATGRSPQTFSSVTIVAPTGLEADALSTAVFVLGVEEGLPLVKATPGTDAFLVLKDGRTFATDGFPTA